MEIVCLNRLGVPRAETSAHQQIASALNRGVQSKTWKGYAAFSLTRQGGGSGNDDFDVVLITHSAILVIELKNWNGKALVSDGTYWYVDGQKRPSPVPGVQLKAKKLASALRQQIGDAKTPFVASFVCLHGNLAEAEFQEDESQSVLFLEDIMAWANDVDFRKSVWSRPRFPVLQQMRAYDHFFQGPAVKPKVTIIDGFRPEPKPLLSHPRGLYTEHRAYDRDDPKVEGLLRQWDFSALGTDLIGEGDRAFLGLREQNIYDFVEERNPELATSLLRVLKRKTPQDVSMDFVEVFRLPARFKRLAEFTHATLPAVASDERLGMVKALLAKFAELHELTVAHRDIGEHCLWLDRPAGVIVSGFPAAYYPAMKTVGAFRERVKIEQSLVPEDGMSGVEQSPYKRDVFMLAVAAHILLFQERPPKANNVYQWSARAQDDFDGRLDAWFERALNRSPADRFSNAREMLEALNASTRSDERPLVDPKAFNAFSAATRERDYTPIEYFADAENKSVFRAGSDVGECLVKVWFEISPAAADSEGALQLLAFLERCRTLKACEFEGVQRVRDFGLSRGSLLLVLEWVPGVSLHEWLESGPGLADRLEVSQRLLAIVSHLHALGLTHGDIHPGNIVVTSAGVPVLIDALDYRRGRDAYTTEYLPANYKSLSPEERDRYGVAFVLLLLLRRELADEHSSLPTRVRDELTLSMQAASILSLDPLVTAFAEGLAVAKTGESPTFRVSASANGFSSAQPVLYDDNGKFHVSVRADKSRKGGLYFRITGVGCELTFGYDRDASRVIYSRLKAIPQSAFIFNVQRRDASFPMRLVHDIGGPPGLGPLPDYLLSHPGLAGALEAAAQSAASPTPAQVEGVEEDAPAALPRLEATTKEIWRALIAAEEDTFRTVVVAGDHRPNPRREEQALVPYANRSGTIDYEADDEVTVEFLRKDGKWGTAGMLALRDTTFGDFAELALDERRMSADLRPDSVLRLISKDERASYTRRKDAVDRILEAKSTIPLLIEYLSTERLDSPEPTRYPEPTREDLSPYAGTLNAGQEDAFRAVIGHGPISLLQGPPGTGKTTFIACLIHYLVTKERARRILLVSQAHEAVNNALEKSLDLSRSLGTPFNAVRLGADTAVSAPIRHIHSASLEQSYRERFRAEQRQRIVALGVGMGLPPAFCTAVVDLHQHLGALGNRIRGWYERQAHAEEEELIRIEARVRSLKETFDAIAREKYGAEDLDDVDDVIDQIEQQIMQTHEIYSLEAFDKLRQVIRLSDDWIDSLGSREGNFLEFLAKSRTIVAGTCVGIGFKGAGVTQNIYDWVIIDEAARAAPSEIAVAMQTGKRILLVGDHKQLPPLFTDDVKAMVQAKFNVPEGESDSLFVSDFERLFNSPYGRRVGKTLTLQYRMAPAIGELVSSCFYEKLDTGRGGPPDYYGLLPSSLAKEVIWVDTGLDPAARELIVDGEKSASNESEARAILSTLKMIFGSAEFMERLLSDIPEDEPAIGIICMYDKQRALIEKYKAEAEWMRDMRKRVKVDSVDGYQGKENRIVLVSTVRNNPRGNPGFLRSPNRINVAMSRAMERLIVFGASKMWTGRNESLPLGRVLTKVRELEGRGLASIANPNQVRGQS